MTAHNLKLFSWVAVGLAVTFLSLSQVAYAQWGGPPASAPGSNAASPLNVGSALQTRGGPLSIGNVLDASAITVYGNQNLYRTTGSYSYINFGSPSTGGVAGCCGDPGYGIRDFGGTLQFKNYSGTWQSLATLVGTGGQWTTSGTNIYNVNTGNVGVGTGNPGQKLDVVGTVRASAFVYSSDGRLKENVRGLKDGLLAVLALSPVSFVWNDGPEEDTEDIGFIAQELERVVPIVVDTDSNGMKSVDYPKLVPILVKAIQEQQAQIDALRLEIQALREIRE